MFNLVLSTGDVNSRAMSMEEISELIVKTQDEQRTLIYETRQVGPYFLLPPFLPLSLSLTHTRLHTYIHNHESIPFSLTCFKGAEVDADR